MPEQTVEMSLPNGATALARVSTVDGVGAAKTAALPKQLDFAEFGKTLEGLASGIRSSLAEISPDKVTVALGLDLAVKNGKLSGLLVEGEGKGSIAVTLEWGNEGSG